MTIQNPRFHMKMHCLKRCGAYDETRVKAGVLNFLHPNSDSNCKFSNFFIQKCVNFNISAKQALPRRPCEQTCMFKPASINLRI